MSESKPEPSKPRPLFIYGTLRALPLLAWALTGDASNISARKKLEDFEGEAYKLESVAVTVLGADENNQEENEIVEADIYLWAGDADALTVSPWDLKTFEEERLGDWIDLFEGMELVGEKEESTATR
ncbi:AIG2-like protein [Xylaria digitata]|nr:AIG2-like protein [Xylaria digitata]